MNLVIEPRHWLIMTGAILAAGTLYWGLPKIMGIYPVTLWAFPLLAISVALNVSGSASEGRRWPWKAAAWAILAIAALMALWPLRAPWEDLQRSYLAWAAAGFTPPRAAYEALEGLSRHSPSIQQASLLSFGLGTALTVGTIALPIRAAFDPKHRKDRRSRSGPWRAGWMKPQDVAQLARNKTGLPLAIHNGKILRYPRDTKGWRGGHHLVIAGTRGGKGVSAVIPAILEQQGPVVALDIKGENFAVTRRHRESLGRKVAVLNPFSVIEPSKDQFNPLDYIRAHELTRDIDVIADGLVKREVGDGAHFAEMAKNLVGAAIEVIVTQEEPETRNLVAVADLLMSPNLTTTLKAWAKSPDLVGHRPAQEAATLLAASDKERGAIQTTVSKAFAWMQSDAMRVFLSDSSFDLDDILDDKLDLFIVVPLDQIDKQAVFMRLFVNLVIGTAIRQQGTRNMKAPTLLALDEFVRMGRMEQIIGIATVSAGAGFEALFVTQDAGQVEDVYKSGGTRAIFGSCITTRIFNLNDIETCEWAARHLGDRTVYSQQIKEEREPLGARDYSYSEQRQKLMTEQEIRDMPEDNMLLIVGNRAPLRAKLNRYYEQKQYKGMFDRNPLS